MGIELPSSVIPVEWRVLHSSLSLMGLPVMSHTAWETQVATLQKHMEAIASASCEQVREKIIQW